MKKYIIASVLLLAPFVVSASLIGSGPAPTCTLTPVVESIPANTPASIEFHMFNAPGNGSLYVQFANGHLSPISNILTPSGTITFLATTTNTYLLRMVSGNGIGTCITTINTY